MSEQHYSIQLHHNLVCVRLQQQWSQSVNILYLSELAQQIQQVNSSPWGMIVDMRDWLEADMPMVDNQATDSGIYLDRRNQIAECWIVREQMQGESIVKYIEAAPTIAFRRFLASHDAVEWMQQQGLTVPNSFLLKEKSNG